MTIADLPHATAMIGTAGWSIPKALAADLPGEGTHLERYAARLRAAEINSSFYRPHRTSTYAKWAGSVPDDFRFSIKLPKTITHQHKLVGCSELLSAFAAEIAALGDRRGPVLVQLPPSLSFDAQVASEFFKETTDRLGASIACEPRHATWFQDDADRLLRDFGIARVAADPAICAAAAHPGGWPGLVYVRLHGSPAVYRSPYDPAAIERQRRLVLEAKEKGAQCWTIFDNTASGAALANALELSDVLEASVETRSGK